MKKRLGQHFLIDAHIAQLIVGAAGLTRNDAVVEIGPGRGELTGLIAREAGSVAAVELDGKLCALLRKKFAGGDNVKIINRDFLDIGFEDIFPACAGHFEGAVKVIGNIPYYITAPILTKLFEWKKYLSRVVLTVQKEVAERMAAPPGRKIYGALSVFVQFNSRIRQVMVINRECFRPAPDVDSAVVVMEMFKEPPFAVKDEAVFSGFVKSMFASKRKMVHNALAIASCMNREEARAVLNEVDIDPGRRPETLSVSDYVKLFNRARERELECLSR